MSRKHYKDSVDYYKKEYIIDQNGNKKSNYVFDRKIKWYFNQNTDTIQNIDGNKLWEEYVFTCNLWEEIKRWNYIIYKWERYNIQNFSEHEWISIWQIKITLVKQ